MANIGTFTAEKDGFTGTLRTLTLNVKVKLVPNDKGDNESAPDYRLQAAGHDIGAAWKKTSEAGRPYVSVTLDDPSFPATVYARLIEGEDGQVGGVNPSAVQAVEFLFQDRDLFAISLATSVSPTLSAVIATRTPSTKSPGPPRPTSPR